VAAAAAREFAVEVTFDEPPARFAIDQEAEVAIRVGNAHGLIVPLSAVIRQKEQPGVLVARGGRVHFQPIEAGSSGKDKVLVRKGLTVGESIVHRAQAIKPGARVRPVEE